MNLEDRLRAELDHSARSARVGAAPSIDELASVANERRHRNRVLGASGAVLLSSALLFGAFYASQPNNTTTLEVADSADTEAAGSAEAADQPADEQDSSDQANEASPDVPSADGAVDTATNEATDTPVEDDQQDASSSAGSSDTQSSEAPAEPQIADFGTARLLQADNTPMQVETRESAVGLASGSGILVVPDGAGGYRGLGVSFDDGITAMSLASANGLDWTSTELVGVPDGATASRLEEHDGTFVAMFERFDEETGLRQIQIGTSVDMITWDVAEPLAGGEVFATDIAVGSPGVIVIGDDRSPQIWSGPIGGPYEPTARLDALALNGVTTVGNEFIVAGRSDELGVALFRSGDGENFEAQSLASAGVDPANHTVSVDDGTIILRSIDNVVGTLVSSDGGQTWTALVAASEGGVSVSASTLGFLGEDGSSSVVAIADDDTFSTAQIDVVAPDRLRLVASGDGELVMVQTSESGTTWIVATR